MRNCLIIGATGFLGSAVAIEAAARRYEVIPVTRTNYAQFKDSHADILIHAAGNSRKFIDDKDPTKGFDESVGSVMRVLRDFQFAHYIHLSSGAVYPDEGNPSSNTEDAELQPEHMTHYGFHKWMAENLVMHYAPRHLILRLGGFVGPGLKKNAVYDLLKGGQVFVHPDSEFQFMDSRDMARILFDLCEQAPPNGVMNLSASGTVSVRQIAAWAGANLTEQADSLPLVRAELNLKMAESRLQLPTSHETVKTFIDEVKRGEIILK
jgi:nucleoside-diphosphate-sugar epimerase